MPNNISRALGYFGISLIFLLFVAVFWICFRGQDPFLFACRRRRSKYKSGLDEYVGRLQHRLIFVQPRCLSFADNWLRLQCVVVVNANPVSGNDAKLEDYVSSVLLKISAQFQIKNFDFRDTFKT